MIAPAHVHLVEDIEGTSLGLEVSLVDLGDAQPMAQFDTHDAEDKYAFGIVIQRPLTNGMRTTLHTFPEGALLLNGGTLWVDLFAIGVERVIESEGPCPECFGTGFKGGFQAACSKGCGV